MIKTEPLICHLGDNRYQGNDLVMNLIERLTSILGIEDYKLYKTILKEYKTHRSVYDMSHNSPKLLLVKTIGIASVFALRGQTHTLGSIDSLINQYLFDSSGLMNDLKFEFNFDLYPVAPDYLRWLPELLEKIRPYIDKSHYSNWEDFSRFLYGNSIYSYYMAWDLYLKRKPLLNWIDGNLWALAELASDEQGATVIKNIINRYGESKKEIKDVE